jgi:hypothetical protein
MAKRKRTNNDLQIRIITKLPNSEQAYKGKVKTHKYINRQNQSTTGNCENCNDPNLVQVLWEVYNLVVPVVLLEL